MSLERVVGENWIDREVVRKVGNREHTRFWLDKWVGNEALFLTFPRLFSISCQKEAMVGEVWVDRVEGGDWHFMWRRNLFVWEEGLLQNLRELIDGWEKVEEVDSWWWKLEREGKFSVSLSYASLERLVLSQEPLERTKEVVFGILWKSPAPSKVVVFSWQLLLNRIPTKDNLLSRRIIAPVSLGRCEFCEQAAETANHLFLHCYWTFKVWSKVGRWLGINFITPQSLFQHFEGWNGEIGRRKL